MSRIIVRWVAFAGVFLVCASCSTIDTKHRDWSQYSGPGAQFFKLEQPPPVELMGDYPEPTNRSFSAFNYVFLNYIVSPVSSGYRFIFRKPVRNSISKFGYNLAFPRRAVANLMEGEPGAAGIETVRFLVNITIGIVGFFDPATSMGIPKPDPEDVGLAFGHWGWNKTNYLSLPFMGPSSSRDLTAEIFDIPLNLANWVPGLGIFLGLNSKSDNIEGIIRFIHSVPDPYEYGRYFWSIIRDTQLKKFKYKTGQGPGNETLKAMFLTFQDIDFPLEAEVGDVLIPETGKELPYSYWLQEGKGPVLYILPGLGAYRESNHSLALAEMGYDNGFNVVVISSAFHPEFMNNASTVDLPGYPVRDAADIQRALKLIHQEMVEEHSEHLTGKKALMGMSMGAFHTVFIAASEKVGSEHGLNFDQFLAINPPVRLRYGAMELDKMYLAADSWPEDEREARIMATLNKAANLISLDEMITPDVDKDLSFGREEARYLIGLGFRLTLRDVMYDSQYHHNQKVLLTELDNSDRGPAYVEILRYSWMMYFYAFVMPYYQSIDAALKTDRDFFEKSDLRSLAAGLDGNSKVLIYTTSDDFLLSSTDHQWLKDTFSERLTLFEGGGHLGEMYKKEVQKEVMAKLSWLVPAGLSQDG